MCLNIKAKFWFYEKTNDLVVFMFPNDPEAKNNLQRPIKIEQGKRIA